MSTILFDTTFNLLLDFIKKFDDLGYATKPPLPIKSLRKAYPDDLTIITSRIKHSQKVLNAVVEWLLWTKTMRAKPVKCRTLAAKFFTSKTDRFRWEPHTDQVYSTFDPHLSIEANTFRLWALLPWNSKINLNS